MEQIQAFSTEESGSEMSGRNPFFLSLADNECCVFKKCCKAYKKKGKHCKKCPKKKDD